VLDFVCGNGQWLDRFRPAAYTGIDLNRAMLVEARRRYSNARFLQADMPRLPLPDASVDGVLWMFFAIGHLPAEGQRATVGEVRRLPASGGLAILANANVWLAFALPPRSSSGGSG